MDLRAPWLDPASEVDWSVWVLEHGLPDLPAVLGIGDVIPVARWIGPDLGGVLYVRHLAWGEPTDDDYEVETDGDAEVLRRVDGSWEPPNGSGGGGWIDPPFQRPADLGPREVDVWHFGSRGAPDSWTGVYLYGITGTEATSVEVIDATGTVRNPIESPFGAFIACADGSAKAVLRVLDAEEQVLHVEEFDGPHS
jgi:hypothetical protein